MRTVPREVGCSWHTDIVKPDHGYGATPAISADSVAKWNYTSGVSECGIARANSPPWLIPTASGKLFFSLLPARTRKRLLETLPLERRTARALVEPALLEAEFARIRDLRFGTDNEDFINGLVAASVPVLDAGGRPIAAVAVHGLVGRSSLERGMSLVQRLRQAADALAGALEVA